MMMMMMMMMMTTTTDQAPKRVSKFLSMYEIREDVHIKLGSSVINQKYSQFIRNASLTLSIHSTSSAIAHNQSPIKLDLPPSPPPSLPLLPPPPPSPPPPLPLQPPLPPSTSYHKRPPHRYFPMYPSASIAPRMGVKQQPTMNKW